MSNATYAEFVKEFSVHPIEESAIGICEEAAEVAGVLKKHIYQGRELDRENLIKELGDNLYYIVKIANAFDASLEEIQDVNMAKLRARFPDGPRGRNVR